MFFVVFQGVFEMKVSGLFFVAALAAVSLPLGAQTPPPGAPDAGSIMRTPGTVRPPETKEPQPDLPLPEAAPPEEETGQAVPDETLFIQSFRIEDAAPLTEAEVQTVLTPYAGRNLTMAQIEEAAQAVTALYRSRGFLMAYAYLPRQDARSGVLTLALRIGRYGQVTIRNESLARDAAVAGLFAPLRSGEAIERPALERALLLAAALPGAKLPKVSLAAGKALGEADLLVEVPAGRRATGFAVYDNQGSRYTGRHRVGLGAIVNSPTGIGDSLMVSGVFGRNGASRMGSGRAAYSAPAGWRGARVDVALDRTVYSLGETYRDLDATGRVDSAELGGRYPLIRTHDTGLELGATVATRLLRDEFDALDYTIEKRVRVATLKAAVDHWGALAGRTAHGALELGLTLGRLSFDDAEQKADDRAGVKSAGDYSRLNLNGTLDVALAPKVNATLTLAVQRALGRSLDSSERLMISGPSGVKAYRESVTGDHGFVAGLEVRYVLPPVRGVSHAVGVFADHGQARFVKPRFAVEDKLKLSDVGLGYYASRAPFFMKALVAHKVGAQPDEVVTERDGRTHFLFQFGAIF
jgi:hemolysin activation/secretion protein